MWDEFQNVSGDLPGDDIIQYGANFGPFHNYSEFVHKIHILNETFPHLIDLSIIGQSYYSRNIWCVVITDETTLSEKDEMLIVSQHHAREQITVEQSLYIIDKIIYFAQNTSDPIWHTLQSRILYIIPSLNVDGASIIHRYPYQRKTLHPYDEDGDGIQDEFNNEIMTIQIEANDTNGDGFIEMIMGEEKDGLGIKVAMEGTDLDQDGVIGEDAPGGADPNRNYPYDFGNPSFSSPNPNSQSYHGPKPLSENCTRVLADFTQAHHFSIALSLHSGVYTVYQPSYSQDPMHPKDYILYSEIGQKN